MAPKLSSHTSGSKEPIGSRSSSSKITPITVERYLKGVDFPAKKQQMMNQARKNSAPADVIKVLQKISDKEYHNPVEVAQEIGKCG